MRSWRTVKVSEKAINVRDLWVGNVGLWFEYVAFRDIQNDEEVIIDYQDEWQTACDQHVKDWKPTDDAEINLHSSKYQMEQLKTPAETTRESLSVQLGDTSLR